jgi:hypothetical protein
MNKIVPEQAEGMGLMVKTEDQYGKTGKFWHTKNMMNARKKQKCERFLNFRKLKN